MKPWFLYILICADDSVYTGVTTDVRRRLKQHNEGRGAKYTRSRRPCDIIAAWEYEDRSAALSAEYRFKQQSHDEKIKITRRKTWLGGTWFADLDGTLYTELIQEWPDLKIGP